MNRTSCDLIAYRSANEMLVVLAGSLRLYNSESVKKQILELIDSEPDILYLHLGQLVELDSAGLGVLVGVHIHARKRKIELKLLSPSAPQMKLLETTRLTAVLTIVSGVEAQDIRNRIEKAENQYELPSTSG